MRGVTDETEACGAGVLTGRTLIAGDTELHEIALDDGGTVWSELAGDGVTLRYDFTLDTGHSR